MTEKEDQFEILKSLAKDVHHIQKTISENKPVKIFKKKNISVADDWIISYAKQPEPKLPFSKFCTMAIQEKLERDGVIDKS